MGLAIDGAKPALLADFSINVVRDLAIAEGKEMPITLPRGSPAGLPPRAAGAMTARAALPSAASLPATRRRLDRDDLLMRGGICLLIGWMLVTLVLPL